MHIWQVRYKKMSRVKEIIYSRKTLEIKRSHVFLALRRNPLIVSWHLHCIHIRQNWRPRWAPSLGPIWLRPLWAKSEGAPHYPSFPWWMMIITWRSTCTFAQHIKSRPHKLNPRNFPPFHATLSTKHTQFENNRTVLSI